MNIKYLSIAWNAPGYVKSLRMNSIKMSQYAFNAKAPLWK